MVDISRKSYERNGIETIIDNDEILWLNEKHIEEELDQRKRKYELEEPNKQLNRIFIDKVIIQSNYRLYNNNGS